MSGLALSVGTLLPVLQGKKVYQPIWQIIAVNSSQSSGNFSNQILVSDGKQLSYNVILHPSSHLTFDRSQLKSQKKSNCVGKAPEKILSSFNYAIIKVTEFQVQKKENISVIFLSKLKLVGCEKFNSRPKILNLRDVEVILGNCEVVTRSREGLEQFDVPAIEINKMDDYDDMGSDVDYKYSVENRPYRSLSEEFSAQGFALSSKQKMKKTSAADLLSGELAPLGPLGLNILCLCPKCLSLAYTADNRITSFRPSVSTLVENLKEILPSDHLYEFCSCDEEKDQFRAEFQNKCMVVNQDTSSTGQQRKVQCILVSKETSSPEEEQYSFKGSQANTEKSVKSYDSSEAIQTMVPISKKTARVSHKLRLCEHCGVEERDMTACKHCAKVWYCSADCKKADVKLHTSVCRAYITVRRYQEEKAAFARKIQEPEDGCGTCGFWRESLEPCNKCGKVSYCSYGCKDKAAEKHKPVCEALAVIQSYRSQYLAARSQEVD